MANYQEHQQITERVYSTYV